MSFFSDKQFLVVAAVGAVAAWVVYKKAGEFVETVGEVGESAVYLGGYYGNKAIDEIDNFFTLDEFDKKYRNQAHLMNDEQYARWKKAVQSGQIPNSFD